MPKLHAVLHGGNTDRFHQGVGGHGRDLLVQAAKSKAVKLVDASGRRGFVHHFDVCQMLISPAHQGNYVQPEQVLREVQEASFRAKRAEQLDSQALPCANHVSFCVCSQGCAGASG